MLTIQEELIALETKLHHSWQDAANLAQELRQAQATIARLIHTTNALVKEQVPVWTRFWRWVMEGS